MRAARAALVRRAALAGCVAGSVLAWAPPGRAEGALDVCLDKAALPSPPKGDAEVHGFDHAVARALARRLGRTLAVRWYETETDRDGDPVSQMNALLSDGRCRLVLGQPLFAGAFGRPRAERARLPDHDGAKPDDRRRWVKLGELVAGRGYRFDPLVVVSGPGAARREIRSLADLKDLRLVAEEGTLADAVLMMYGGGVLVGRITHVAPGGGLFEGMERGEFDATLVELRRFDGHRARHPGTGLSWPGHAHSIGFNVGPVALASEAPLMAEVNAAIGEMLAGGEMAALARAAGVTYLPPREPDISGAITPARLRGD